MDTKEMTDSEKRIESYMRSKLIEHQYKSDAELRKIAMDCTSKTLATNNVVELEDILAELKACNEIISERRNQEQKIASAKEKWKQQLPERQRKTILNLKAAVSPNGQLIAAILEDEEGLTASEIGSWCEELSSLPDEDLQELLAELKKEKVIEQREDKKYYLRQICTEDLFPEDRVTWALQKAQEGNCSSKFAARAIKKLASEKCALAPEDLWRTYAYAVRDSSYLKKDFDYSEKRSIIEDKIGGTLRALCSCGALACYSVNGCKLYFFPMLGDEGGKWA